MPDDFGIWLTALIGPDGDVGEEVFGVTACSPQWLARTTVTENTKGFEFVRHRLVVSRWDPDLLRRAIGDLCRHTSGSDWPEVAAKLSHYLAWEFEDYTSQ
jgi:phytoene dehydrogenase-like protein